MKQINSKKTIRTLLVILMTSTLSIAQTTKEGVIRELDQTADTYAKAAKQIWEWAEVSFQEEKAPHGFAFTVLEFTKMIASFKKIKREYERIISAIDNNLVDRKKVISKFQHHLN